MFFNKNSNDYIYNNQRKENKNHKWQGVSLFTKRLLLKKAYWVLNSLLISLTLSACENPNARHATSSANERQIATTYRTLNATNCHQTASIQSPIIADLRANRLVDLVAVRGSVIRAENIHWLHVYPRLSHRPSCYIPMTNLVPVE